MEVSSLDGVERAEKMLELIRGNNQDNLWTVIEKIGEAEVKRGDQIMKYVDKAQSFFKEMSE